MKKFPFYLLLAASVFAVPSCGGDDEVEGPDGGNDGGDSNNPEYVITEIQAQNEIERVAREVRDKINPASYRDLYELAAYAEELFLTDDYDEPSIEYPEYPLDSTYYGAAAFNTLKRAASGDLMAYASLRNTSYSTADIEKYYGTWSYNEKMEEWQQTSTSPTDAIVYSFTHDGKAVELKIAPDTSKEYELSDSTRSFSFPAETKVVLTEDGKQLAGMSYKVTACDQVSKNYALTSQVSFADVVIDAATSDNNSLAQSTSTLKIGGDAIMEANASVNGKNLAEAGQIYNEVFDAENNLNNGSVTLKIMNSLIISATADNNDKQLAQAIQKDLDYEKYEWEEWGYDSISDSWGYTGVWYVSEYGEKNCAENANNLATVLSAKSTGSLSFQNGSYECPISWQAYKVYEDNYSWDKHSKNYVLKYDVQPLLNFNGGATYTFADYFTQDRFSTLIDMMNELANSFEREFGN